ncbi:50S ribosomal protein L2, partial [Pseudomonas sp. FW305-130]
SGLHKGGPVKALTEGKRKTGGRNNKGHVTSRGIAGGHKQRYRIIDFKRRNWGVDGVVERIEYDPNRTAFIALINYGQTADGKENVAYIIA